MENQSHEQNWWYLLKKNFPVRQFIFGAIIPIILFYSFHRFDRPLYGAFFAAGWGIMVATISQLLLKKKNLFAMLAVPFSLIELVSIIVTYKPEFYLAAQAIEKAIWGLVYLGSVAISRPLISIFAKAMGLFPNEKNSKDYNNSGLFRSALVTLTIIWGVIHLFVSVLLIISQIWLPLELFLVIRTASGLPLIAILLAFSFWFPGRYLFKNQLFEALNNLPGNLSNLESKNERSEIDQESGGYNNQSLEVGKWEIVNSTIKTPDKELVTFSAYIDIQEVTRSHVKGRYTVSGEISDNVSFSSKITKTSSNLPRFIIRSFNTDIPCALYQSKLILSTPGGIIIFNKSH